MLPLRYVDKTPMMLQYIRHVLGDKQLQPLHVDYCRISEFQARWLLLRNVFDYTRW